MLHIIILDLNGICMCHTQFFYVMINFLTGNGLI